MLVNERFSGSCYRAQTLASILAKSQYQGWRELLRKHTKYQRKHIAISEGETLVAVIEITRGNYIFVRNNEEDKKSYE